MAAQARRKSAKFRIGQFGGKFVGKFGGNLAGVAMLLAGMVIGVLATILWQGTQTADDGVGAGIRRMIESDHEPTSAGDEKNTDRQQTQPAKPSTPFDFFTVLPEIEVVAPATPAAEVAAEVGAEVAAEVAAETRKKLDGGQSDARGVARDAPATDGGSYMLQAASYQQRAEADRLKATLALNGMLSVIQKVSIQGRGDFYRVRLGPYLTYAAMVQAEQQLSRAGIKALRLKVSRG